nr:reverse transcriptase domain-containing protein [Tanacetum cinerariifolium]
MPTLRTAKVDLVQNDEALEINLDLLEEKREQEVIREAKSKEKKEKYYNSKVRSASFKPGDLVYRNNDASRAEDSGKLGPKWKRPYEVTEALGKGAYKLRDRNGKQLPQTSSVISISSDVSVESVGSYFSRVILLGSISVEVLVTPEVGAAAVASHAEVLELDTHSSSEADPIESSPPPVSVAPMVLPFLCSNDSKSDTEIPEREDITIGQLYRTHPEGPCKALTTRKTVKPLLSYCLALRHSSLGNSLSRHTPPNTTDANSSTPHRFVHPPIARTPWCSEANLRLKSAPLSTMYPPTTSESSARDSFFESSAGPSYKRCRSPAATEDIDTDVLEDIKADATAVEVTVDKYVEAGIDASVSMKVNVGIDHLEQVEEGLQDIYDHVIEIPLKRIEDIETAQR